MGWMDNFVPDFLKQRDGDFVKLDENDCAFGPGPLLIMYDAPDTIDDEEICDMMHDEAPDVGQCQIFRITSSSSYSSYSLLDLSLRDALEQISSGRSNLDVTAISNSEANESPQESLIPVLFFSGFRNSDMMAIYNILGKEIYQETAGQSTPACAKAVPNAMMKPLRQVLSEITGDHQDAIDMQKNDLRSFE